MIEYLEEAFHSLKDHVKSQKMSAYMRHNFPFYGIEAPRRKKIYQEYIRKCVKEKLMNWELLKMAYDRPEREWQYFVIDYLIAYKRQLSFDDLMRIEYFLRNKQWWDSIDGLDEVVGHIVANDNKGKDYILQLAQDENFWVRRIAIDHQLGFKEKTNVALLEEIILLNLGSKEFFINKAIGWSLRDYSKTNPDWVRNFIKRYEGDLSSLSIREASKYLK